ncbi:MAG: undecaprenyl-diphosphatase UppP [Campylobacteraceae bacterium]|jgi:undecaprenyl-diphosphatase|nr:undecaprenyl-diphosphatase UppP [Campylobacteraceae bacterium]MBT3881853.1 undecaprenyl-diphosphatase UppP [Campylobacteraceae bacterium]MBT4030823.1 undecaprenyl-diphosphatase UppP [Campylobacteraceae bacterium]MBT4179920.1 undecaprenyl-diphosphatase UppP [Campylobacteraceae bacterium]MBT4572627.1 undecaprenyl-diphosphatase UppP [Campylobacteraceae bacterium]
MTIFDSIILGIVEGITEFLPVSSTAHLILTAKLLGLQETASLKAYETIIQFGAILAVLFIYKDKVFWSKDKTAPNSIKNTLILWIKLAIAFIPTGIAGLFLYSSIKAFFTPSATVWFMIVTGIVFIIVEKIHKEQHHHTDGLNNMSYTKSILVGLFQAISLLPGVSRSGATIIGGLLIGLKRKTAVEFSFLLALPTMLVATCYEIYKGYDEFVFDSMLTLGVGFVVSFIFSYLAVKWFLKFVENYTFIPFGIYLIISGIGFYFLFL